MGLRWGVLGAARIADTTVIPAILANSGSEVTAIASRDAARARDIAQRHGIGRVELAYDDILKSPDIDAVYIPLANSDHFRWTLAALRANKHVLCEKPIALHASEVRELIAARDSTGLVCAEAMMIVHHPQWTLVTDALRLGRIGRLLRVDGCFTYYLDDPHSIRNRAELGGGGLRDIGVYPIAATRIATGLEPEHIQTTVSIDARSGTDTYASGVASFNGFDLHFLCGTLMARRQSMVFHGTDGWIEMSAPFTSARYREAEVVVRSEGDGRLDIERFGDTGIQYQRMVANFEAAVTSGASLLYPLESSLNNQRIIDQALMGGAKAV
jgi:predicted dehydrogenase